MRRPNTASIIIRTLYALCMAGAAFNHARIVADHGLTWQYGGVHPLLALFWTALTFIDPLAVVLLIVRPRAGLLLTAAIIGIDVIVNGCAGFTYGIDWAAFGAQALFLVIVLATLRPALRGTKKDVSETSIVHHFS
jgi:hypothetical protein